MSEQRSEKVTRINLGRSLLTSNLTVFKFQKDLQAANCEWSRLLGHIARRNGE